MPPKKKQKQAAPPTLTQPKLLAAASHVLANHYSKPYEVPATAKEDEDYWYTWTFTLCTASSGPTMVSLTHCAKQR